MADVNVLKKAMDKYNADVEEYNARGRFNGATPPVDPTLGISTDDLAKLQGNVSLAKQEMQATSENSPFYNPEKDAASKGILARTLAGY